MPNDALALGGFVFTEFAVPNLLPGGGKHNLKVHKLPGGDRYIDAMGPDDDDRQFTILHFGPNTQSEILQLDQMRIAGAALPYSNGMEARIVVISSYTWQYERFPNLAHSTISLTPVDNPAGSQGSGEASDDQQNSDLDSANGTASDNAANSPSTAGGGSGAAAGSGAALPQTAPLPPQRPPAIGSTYTSGTSIGAGGQLGHA